ncbi:hypothetical protein P8610_18105 [Fictibacillus sp. UD]|uniref:hypothetical protein n=1 Tax=Fictibacillus sp. UD TaxID=3038777 RepID=UPI003745208C
MHNRQDFKRSVPTESSKTFNKENNIYYKKTKANDEIQARGRKILNSLNKEEYNKIGSKEDTLHFIFLLGLASKKKTIKVNETRVKDISTPIGVRLKTDIDIEVFHLKEVTKNKDTGIDLTQDVEYKTVKAGVTFDLTLYEFMYLIIRDEYGGFLKVYKKDFYAHLSVKLPAFLRGDAKLPTPTIVFQKENGSARASIIDIDIKTPNGWEIKSEFKRFEPFIKRRKRK